ncbi:glutathione S-transferase family protein [Woeseia oceani]|uniref:Glutathione S-transferase n=1 Tax=Woeseia oceani TaxID=1548547 RepID=A0A193LDN7_9GAMM|nr:glutathione S-transferase family protein [Woeseia oceani]ANO50593.1 glutathione S-transferase [Woeseia oceani]
MTQDIVLYTNPMSRGRIARWMLEEVAAPYRTVILEYGADMKSPEYLAVNPMGKVPALQHGSAIITECAAICAYLADAFPDSGLAPPLTERAAYYRWLFFVAGPLESALNNKALGVEVPVERERMVGYGKLATVVDTLEAAVQERPFIAGDTFSAADVYVGSHVGWGLQFGTLDKRPAFEDYWSRISGRDALQRANALDDVDPPAG